MITRMGIAEFRRRIHEVTEPVEVLKGLQTVGFFYPEGDPPARQRVERRYVDKLPPIAPGEAPLSDIEPRDPPAQQTLQPARTAPRTFRPVPKPVPTKK